MEFDGFDWDEGNLLKCQKHGVSTDEIESLFTGSVMIVPDATHSAHEVRSKAIGQTAAGRWLFLVFSLRERGEGTMVRPVSARYMHVQEVRRYEDMANPHKRH